MNELMKSDLHLVLSRIPKDITKILKENPNLFIAGGFIRSTIAGEKVNDFDIFGDTKKALEAEANILANNRRNARLIKTDNAYTVLCGGRKPVQFIYRWLFEDPKSCADSFDFTVAQAVVWFDGKDWQSGIAERFYADLAARRLYYTAPKRNEDAGGSILRVRKFLKAGYNIQAPSLSAVIARLIMGVKKPIEEMSEGDLSIILTSLMREVDPLLVIDGIEFSANHEGVEEVKKDGGNLVF